MEKTCDNNNTYLSSLRKYFINFRYLTSDELRFFNDDAEADFRYMKYYYFWLPGFNRRIYIKIGKIPRPLENE